MNYVSDLLDNTALSKELWETIFDSIEVPMMLLDNNHRIIRINKSMKNIAKIFDDVIGKKCYETIHGLCEPPEFCPHSKTIEKNVKHTEEVLFQDQYLLVTTSPFQDSEGQILGSAHIAQDITELKEAEKKVQDTIKLKDLLIKETHHRVKNNLITISGLLYLQSQHIEDPEAKNVLLDSQNRARAMAIIHQKLYSQENLDCINLNYYFKQLLDEVVKTYAFDDKVKCILDIEDVALDTDTSLVLGLIVNELVSNSLKYAFTENEKGTINVSLNQNSGEFFLKISDNGNTISDDIDIENTSSFGLTIVNLLTNQIGGSIMVKRDKGTEFTIRFNRQNFTKGNGINE
ncbi:histidine kinase dimerization/phosphoacceptor domain -containing protein [Methanobacterium sp.]|uniref:sensor histidine kinase n=1 Tax=Methanobacterium sp. TaxID=2164 RepID=UPI003C7719DE